MLTPFDPSKHDITQVAGLIYDSDPEFNQLIFGDREKAIPKIAQMTKISGTFYSAPCLKCWMSGEKINGIVSGYPVRAKHKFEQVAGKAFTTAFGLAGFIRKLPLLIQMRAILGGPMAAEGYYIVYLSVAAEERGKGIGTSIIDELAKDWTKIYLHVSQFNTEAIRFYERNRFIKIRAATMKIGGHIAGANLMRKVHFPTTLGEHPGDFKQDT